ncbi:DENN domain-containing protein 1B-like [Hyla sarda]|uniref:DENN domain-containing protein 1B-like n=1 Tax=Hyla sarda TaxID=327740 RepID=UPI0024C2F94C|nr:DENN domain-containing protein 1B-like [Hyla sarda]XP_056426221.1 DENN domain-containing protein 1B-like [Hyla sarda]
MGSRIKENPDRIFEGFFDVLCPTSQDKDPELKRQFPEHFDDQDSVVTLTKFCFPFDVERWQNMSVQHFSFTLTDLQGYQRFGFCRLSVNAKSCTCILSCLPWFELFYKLLNNIAEHLVKDQVSEVTELLQTLYDHPIPEVNDPLNMDMFSYFVVPDPTKLPSIPENRNLTEFLVAVQVDTMLQLYASLLCERRILITSSKLSTLTACVHASAGVLYPMYWQHIYIPTLPPHLLDYCGAPMPFLIGVHSSLMEKVNTGVLEDAVVFDMDTNNLETPFQDLDNLPQHVVSLLKLRLTKQSALMGDGVSRAFLGAQALLFGSYREALICTPGEPISFCQDTFVNHKCSSMRTFLQNAVHLQLFTQFIDGRLEKLNSGEDFTDVFEQEVTICGLSGASKSYQMWLENLKKGGGTLINNMKNRTHPTVRNMLRYAKGQAKTGLQGMKRRIKHKDHQMQRGGSFKVGKCPTVNHEKLQNRLPITQHFGQSRPRRPGKKFTEGDDSWECQTPGVEVNVVDPGSGEDEFPLLDEGMDLLNEIFETLNTRAPDEGRALYGAHSLDCFNLDDSRYFTRFQSLCAPSDEDLQLSLSQPRTSNLWYLQEVDEGSVDSKEPEPELPSPTFGNMGNASETMEVTSTTETIKDNAKLFVSTPVQNPEESFTISEPTKVTPSVPQASLPIVQPEEEVISSGRELEVMKEESKEQKDVLPVEPCVTTTDTKATNPPSRTPIIVSGPSVRSAISRFQASPIDPRLVWTGTKNESIEVQRVVGHAWSFNTTRPVYNSPKPVSTYTSRPVFNRSQSTPKVDLPKSPTSGVPKPAFQLHSEEGDDPPRKVLPPQPITLSSSSLPKVSELKKKFET